MLEIDELLNDEITYSEFERTTYTEVERDVVKSVELNIVKLVIKLDNDISYAHYKCDVYFFLILNHYILCSRLTLFPSQQHS